MYNYESDLAGNAVRQVWNGDNDKEAATEADTHWTIPILY
jgi:hypothetical protein